jgi:isoquinoline 1-oxidoreductase alpha subunit
MKIACACATPDPHCRLTAKIREQSLAAGRRTRAGGGCLRGDIMAVSFTLNGRAVQLNVPDDMPLLWAIRDVAGLTGTKYGCGIAQCGACTVHLEGEPVRSCSMPIGEVGGKAVVTIEGLATKSGRAVQAAWQKLDVVQCGYCQSGQIMAAAALLEKTPKPSDSDIDGAMTGNLCRCATYHRIRAAIHAAAATL